MNKKKCKIGSSYKAASLAFASVAPAVVIHAEDNSSTTEVSPPVLATLTDVEVLVSNNYVALVKENVNQQLAGIKQDGSVVASAVAPKWFDYNYDAAFAFKWGWR